MANARATVLGALRVRPLHAQEKAAGARVTNVVSAKAGTLTANGRVYDGFHRVLGVKATQQQLHAGVTSNLLTPAFVRGNGARNCMVAMGQSGSGKSYSLFDKDGAVVSFCRALFRSVLRDRAVKVGGWVWMCVCVRMCMCM